MLDNSAAKNYLKIENNLHDNDKNNFEDDKDLKHHYHYNYFALFNKFIPSTNQLNCINYFSVKESSTNKYC